MNYEIGEQLYKKLSSRKILKSIGRSKKFFDNFSHKAIEYASQNDFFETKIYITILNVLKKRKGDTIMYNNGKIKFFINDISIYSGRSIVNVYLYSLIKGNEKIFELDRCVECKMVLTEKQIF